MFDTGDQYDSLTGRDEAEVEPGLSINDRQVARKVGSFALPDIYHRSADRYINRVMLSVLVSFEGRMIKIVNKRARLVH
jgi:hypothetical protein